MKLTKNTSILILSIIIITALILIISILFSTTTQIGNTNINKTNVLPSTTPDPNQKGLDVNQQSQPDYSLVKTISGNNLNNGVFPFYDQNTKTTIYISPSSKVVVLNCFSSGLGLDAYSRQIIYNQNISFLRSLDIDPNSNIIDYSSDPSC
jgi:hypothetical protein